VSYNRKDFYFHKAKKEDFAARSIFKLEEIDQKLRLIRGGDTILDLGAAPGSWSQYCAKKVGAQGRVLGIDLQEIEITLPNACFVKADLRDAELERIVRESGFSIPFNLVISDMAPKTTGIRSTDQARSLELCQLALDTAHRMLKPGGHFICKLFHSEDFDSFRKQLLKSFKKVEAIRPKSTRKESKEIFLVGIGYVPQQGAK
jgi:23S rRNA (uridine2552-2'-O)-methyltransferase